MYKPTRLKRLLAAALAVVILLSAAAAFIVGRIWPLRFRAGLDRFFGSGNWEVADTETRESIIYDVTYHSRSSPTGSETAPGWFTNWDLACTLPDGTSALFRITDHAMRINHDKRSFLQKGWLSQKQAFVLELMDISHQLVSQEVLDSTIAPLLSPAQAACLDVEVMYRGGNPSPGFYSALWKEPWFTVENASAEEYLSSELYDFYLYIRLFDYRAEDLSDAELADLQSKYEAIVSALSERFGEHTDFEIYLGDGFRGEYTAGAPE